MESDAASSPDALRFDLHENSLFPQYFLAACAATRCVPGMSFASADIFSPISRRVFKTFVCHLAAAPPGLPDTTSLSWVGSEAWAEKNGEQQKAIRESATP